MIPTGADAQIEEINGAGELTLQARVSWQDEQPSFARACRPAARKYQMFINFSS
jgi:hypothetical protein